jgi:hypothetical protein
MIYGTPIMGRLLARSSWISVWLQEVQLVFFVWLLCFPSILTSAASGDEKKSLESRPLPLLYNYLSPYLLPVYNAVSNVVPESLWKTVCDNVQSILSLAVTIRLLSEERSATLVQILQESRAVLPPAVTLFMPGFVTQYGVLYVRLILPTAKQQQNKRPSLDTMISCLEYWVLNVLLQGVLSWWSGVLWWIPFSTHGIFLLWCHLQLSYPRYYRVLEHELMAFGLLPCNGKEETLDVDQTVTASVLRSVLQSLPSGVDPDGAVDDNDKKQTP